MRKIVLSAVAALVMASSHTAFGAAALANGALTSAKPTATNPVQRQMQIAADPIGITDFQFSLFFDPNLLTIARNVDEQYLIRGINGYVLGLRNNPTAPAFAINFERGIVSVRGYWPSDNGQVPQEEIDVYDVVFQLLNTNSQGVPIPLDQPFKVDAGGAGTDFSPFGPNFPDFMLGGLMDLQTGRPIIERTYGADLPSPNGILDSTTGIVAIVPEPGAIALLVPVALGLLRRR